VFLDVPIIVSKFVSDEVKKYGINGHMKNLVNNTFYLNVIWQRREP
jgi:hypothetical protein